MVASVGPTCSETLVSHGIAIDLEPVHPKMGPLVQETAQRAKEISQEEGRRRKAKEGPESGVRSPESQYRRTSSPESRIPNPESRVPSPGSRIPNPDRAAWEDSRFLKACRFEAVDATPVWLMRQAGRYMKEYRDLRARVPFLELCKNPALVSEVTVTAAEKLGVDAAIIFADLLLIVEPLGLHLEYGKGEGPVISPGTARGRRH